MKRACFFVVLLGRGVTGGGFLLSVQLANGAVKAGKAAPGGEVVTARSDGKLGAKRLALKISAAVKLSVFQCNDERVVPLLMVVSRMRLGRCPVSTHCCRSDIALARSASWR